MKLSEKLSRELGVEVIFNGGQFEIYSNGGMFTVSMLQAVSMVNQMCNLGIKGENDNERCS